MGGRGGGRSGGGGGDDGDFVMVGPPSVPSSMLPENKPAAVVAAGRAAVIAQFQKPVSIGQFNTVTGLQNVTLRLESDGSKNYVMHANSADGKQAGYIHFSVSGDRVQNHLAKVMVERQGLGTHLYERVVAFSRAVGAKQYVSDSILSYKAAGQWAKMVAKYGGRKNPSSYDGHYNHGKGGKPVYEVDLK